MSSAGESNSVFEMEDLNSATQLIDANHAYENELLNTSLPSILGLNLRQAYLKRSAALYSNFDLIPCDNHPAMEASQFCRDCSLKLCKTCVEIAHPEHDVIRRESAIDEKFDNLAGSIAQFSEMISALDSVTERTAELMGNVIEEKARCQRSIETTFAALQRQLDAHKAALHGELDSTCRKFLAQCEDRLEGWTARRKDLQSAESLKEDVTKELLEGDRDIFAIEASVRSRLMEAKAILPSLLLPNALRLSMRWNERFRNSLSERTLGSPPAEIVNEEYSFEPFKLITEFSARHPNDKAPSCIESMALMKNSLSNQLMLVLVDSANAKIKMLSTNGRSVRCFIGGGRYHLHHPSDLVSLHSGTLLAVCDPGGNKVVIFSERGIGVDHFGVSSCDAIAFLPTIEEPSEDSGLEPGVEEVVVINSELKHLERLDVIVGCQDNVRIRKRKVDIVLEHMNFFVKPRYVVVNSVNGCLFVCDPYEHCLLIFSSEGAFMKKYGRLGCGPGELNGPAALACDLKGRVLVADFHNHRVHQLDPCGNFIRFILTPSNGLSCPQALVLEEDDLHLWVALRKGTIMQFAYS